MWPEGIAFPSASLFAIAEMARRAMEEAVSKPDEIHMFDHRLSLRDRTRGREIHQIQRGRRLDTSSLSKTNVSAEREGRSLLHSLSKDDPQTT